MKPGQKLWTREELILAVNLYCKLPFGQLHQNKKEVIKLAGIIGRTPGSVAFKLVNFASLDPSLQARGIKGAGNTSKLDQEIWNEFLNNWDALPYESELLMAKYKKTSVEKLFEIKEDDLPYEGLSRIAEVKLRVNQSFFRSMIMSSYNFTCCITGIKQRELLVAGHIKPWSIDEKNRLNPRNGIAINALHDKAFENGLITITPDYKIKVSSIFLKQSESEAISKYFLAYNNKRIINPSRFLPAKEFLDFHNQKRFIP
jgi:putative restriction endonuclease